MNKKKKIKMPHAENQIVPHADNNYSHFKSSKQHMYLPLQITVNNICLPKNKTEKRKKTKYALIKLMKNKHTRDSVFLLYLK